MIARRLLRLSALLVCVATVTAIAGTSLSAVASKTPKRSGTVTISDPPQLTPNYIFPLIDPGGGFTQNVLWFDNLLFPPLYTFGIDGKPTDISSALSLAYPPTYLDHNTEVEIRLRPRNWSDGQPVTARDIEFWINLLKVPVAKTQYIPYVPGQFPDNVVGMTVDSASTITLKLNASYNPTWFTDAELALITPLPHQAWDKTSVSGPIGDYDTTPAGAESVYKFLNAQSLNLTTYSTNPLWKVVDGAWRLSAFDGTTGLAEFEPNPAYNGPAPAKISKLIELPYSSDQAELDALKAGQIDYGYLPYEDKDLASTFTRTGYEVKSWPSWGVGFIHVNFTNPATKPMMEQLYFRQVMEMSINQPLLVSKLFGGYATQSYGMTPISPRTSYLSSQQSKNLYPYNLKKARHLLTTHGWHVVRDGTTTCARPGTGPEDCGAGIPRGKTLSFNLFWFAGYDFMQSVGEQMASAFATLGMQLVVRSLTVGNYYNVVTACTPGKPCQWDLGIDFYVYFPQPFPAAPALVQSGASQSEGYSSPTLDRLINEFPTATTVKPYTEYENWLQTQLPDLYYPRASLQISVIKNTLHGTLPQDPLGAIAPQLWTVSRKK